VLKYVLVAVAVGIIWALKLVLGFGSAFAVGLTLGVLGLFGLYFLVRWLLARRAASRLESALAAQGAQQANNARPERRAEIQELQKQLQQGIQAIKSSKMGRGGKRGAAALYSMPWYMIVGPPGAGKTTALKHSGMVFPYGGNTGGGVRGVGGTRNCDWWFTNEAILLDTAGRYTTESDDRDEWLSFLQFLKKYRPNRPINGVIIAISINELVDANEQQIEAIGKKLRARIDEVMTQTHMVVPVYVLFTKIDLVAGFVEFFGDLKKSDRAQPWGATLKLAMPKTEPGKLFDAEFDSLVKQLHSRALKRCVMERSREAREKLYQFPLEFAGLKKNLSDLIAVTFQPNAFQGTPIFRGFYFTSGTQEGKPMDRVLGRMSAAMGIRHGAEAQQGQVSNIESKSYFLHDVFMNIIFPDGDIAARSALEEQRQTFMKLLIAVSTLGLAGLLAFPAFTSYMNNKDFIADSARRAKITAELRWDDPNVNLSKKLPMLDPVREHLIEHDKFDEEGVPVKMSWWMFASDKTYRPKLKVYAAQMNTGFIVPCKTAMEERLRTANGDRYLSDRTALKQYLMLADVEHLDVEWATGRYTQLWAERMKGQSDIAPIELKELMRPHVRYYFELLKRGRISPPELDADLVERVRAALKNVPIDRRYYDLIVNSLSDERIDEAGEPDIDNLVFPPVQLPRIFPDKPDVRKYLLSRSYEAKQGYKQVDGPYTEKGHYGVVEQIKAAEGLLKAEAWVVPLAPGEEDSKNIAKHVANVKTRYEDQYVEQWMTFFADIQVKTPTNADEAIELYRILSTSEYPYRRLLQTLEDHTQWKNANPLEGNDAIAREVNRRFNNRINMYTQGIVVTVDLRELQKKMDKVPTKFLSATKFGLGDKTNPNQDVTKQKGDSRVFRYAEMLKTLKDKVITRKNTDPTFDIRKMNDELSAARDEANALLQGYDGTAMQLIQPLLLAPLDIGVRPTLGQGVDPTQVNKPPPPGTKPPFMWTPPKNPLKGR
jgi:type VI secretion system protein ImpL